jgi:hypothetical protein
MIDPRPICRSCGRRWTPREGQDATIAFCRVCAGERRAEAVRHHTTRGTTVQRGAYAVRVRSGAAKNA